MPQRGERDVNRSAEPPVAQLGRSLPQSQFALRFFGLSAGLFLAAGLIAWVLSRLIGPPHAPGQFIIPLFSHMPLARGGGMSYGASAHSLSAGNIRNDATAIQRKCLSERRLA
jgi:hypothetical protein